MGGSYVVMISYYAAFSACEKSSQSGVLLLELDVGQAGCDNTAISVCEKDMASGSCIGLCLGGVTYSAAISACAIPAAMSYSTGASACERGGSATVGTCSHELDAVHVDGYQCDQLQRTAISACDQGG